VNVASDLHLCSQTNFERSSSLRWIGSENMKRRDGAVLGVACSRGYSLSFVVSAWEIRLPQRLINYGRQHLACDSCAQNCSKIERFCVLGPSNVLIWLSRLSRQDKRLDLFLACLFSIMCTSFPLASMTMLEEELGRCTDSNDQFHLFGHSFRTVLRFFLQHMETANTAP